MHTASQMVAPPCSANGCNPTHHNVSRLPSLFMKNSYQAAKSCKLKRVAPETLSHEEPIVQKLGSGTWGSGARWSGRGKPVPPQSPQRWLLGSKAAAQRMPKMALAFALKHGIAGCVTMGACAVGQPKCGSGRWVPGGRAQGPWGLCVCAGLLHRGPACAWLARACAWWAPSYYK